MLTGAAHMSFCDPSSARHRSLVVSVAAFLLLTASICSAETHKNTHESPNALQLVLESPFDDVVAAVEQVAGDAVLYGTQSFQRERNLTGARRVEHSNVYDEANGAGKVFYKVAEGVLSPTNFKNSADMGTITVRYVITRFDARNTNLRIDAVFIENSSRKVHESDGSVESAEFGEIRKHVEEIAAQHEIDRENAERIARERKDKQAELDLAARQEAAAAAAHTNTTPLSADLEQRVSQMRRQAEMRVTASGTKLKTAPYKGAANVEALAPYTDVVVLIITPYWYGVQTVDGHRGWIHHSELEQLP